MGVAELSPVIGKNQSRNASGLIAMACAMACAMPWGLMRVAAAVPDKPAEDTVGAIEGEAISVQGPMLVQVVRGQIRTVLRSGNDVTVKSGQARVSLVEGGQIVICGPAHFSVLKAGGALTVALDNGTVHARIEREPALTVYTPQIQAKPISIGDGPQDILVGFDTMGAMCIRTSIGALKLEQQLTGQSIIVPQGRDVVVANGQIEHLRDNNGQCACEVRLDAPIAPAPELSRLATTEEIKKRDAEAPKTVVAAPPEEKPAVRQEPVYQVFMPPLAYDAKAKVQRDNFDPKLILLVRRVRVRPTLIFQGRVEGEATPVVAQQSAAPKPGAAAPTVASQTNDSVVQRVRAFFRRLFS